MREHLRHSNKLRKSYLSINRYNIHWNEIADYVSRDHHCIVVHFRPHVNVQFISVSIQKLFFMYENSQIKLLKRTGEYNYIQYSYRQYKYCKSCKNPVPTNQHGQFFYLKFLFKYNSDF